jgi:serine/threonine protein kinase
MRIRQRYFREDYKALGYELNVAPTVYRLGAKLGEGNTAVVYLAVQIEDGREVGPPVAVKFYNPWDVDEGGLEQPLNLERFKREFESIRNVVHPNVIRVLHASRIIGELKETAPAPFIVMEYLTGGDLEKRLRSDPELRGATGAVLDLLRQLAGGLAVIHAADIIHRDFKPANVMFRDKTPVIVDFGFNLPLRGERLTKPGEFLGTLEYASPEQLVATAHVTKKTDVYSFGVVMFQLLTGRNPHPLQTGMNAATYMVNRSAAGRIDPAEFGAAIPVPWANLCAECLWPRPDPRPDADTLVKRLEGLPRPA